MVVRVAGNQVSYLKWMKKMGLQEKACLMWFTPACPGPFCQIKEVTLPPETYTVLISWIEQRLTVSDISP